MQVVKLDTRGIRDWDTFHDVFQNAFGFPAYYGRNMSAWTDCMTNLDSEMSAVRVRPGEMLVLQLEDVADFAERCPEQYKAIVECGAFVNWRRLEIGHGAVLAFDRAFAR